DGSLWAWGENDDGELGDGTSETRTAPVPVVLAPTVIAVDGAISGIALRANGTVWTWGDNSTGQLGDGTTDGDFMTGAQHANKHPRRVNLVGKTSDPAVGIAMGPHHALVLHMDGTVWGWGLNTSGQVGDGTVGEDPTPSALLPVQTHFSAGN